MPLDEQSPPPGHKLGKAFLGISWVIVLVGLTVFFNQYQKKQHNPNSDITSRQAHGTTEVVLNRNRQHHYVASGSINDTPVVFLVDTGATNVSLSAELADKIGLERGYQGIAHTANGTTTTYSTVIDTLRLGDIVFNDVRASITLGMRGNEVLLGMSALKDVELIHKNGQLTIRQ